MFLGQHEHTIDEKGRMTIPARYREVLEQGAYMTQGFEQNLMLLTAISFEQVAQRINEMSMTNPRARELKRLIFGRAERVEFDRAGRFLIPQYLRDIAKLQDGAIVVGLGDFIEIWNPDQWAKQEAVLDDPDFTNDRFEAFDLPVR
jgi:MraZ protein